jgi:CHAT domain-containing protein/tetratricopeptide (TPR) repeat protein
VGEETPPQVPVELVRDQQELERLTRLAQADPSVHPQRIALLQAMLGRMRPEEHPVYASILLQNLGKAYLQLPPEDPYAGVREAIACFQQACAVCPPELSRPEFRRAMANLGLAYTSLMDGDWVEHLYRAIECYEQALVHCDPTRDAQDYANILNALGAAYYQLPDGDWVENLQTAIRYYEETIHIHTADTQPLFYAMTCQNLGEAYARLPTGDRAAHLQQAIVYYQEALRFRPAEADPGGYAHLQVSLGDAYCHLLAGNRAQNTRRAIQHYEEALRSVDAATSPREYAEIVNNLGNAYYLLPAQDRTAYLERARECFDQCLTLFSPETTPLNYATVQNNLGMVHADWPTGERTPHLHKAIACYEQALTLYSPRVAPWEYAATLRNLGSAYAELSEHEPGEHRQQALACYQEALSIYSPETFPQDHRRVSADIGNLSFRQQQWRAAHTAYEAAISSGDLLYHAAATELSRQAELSEMGSLYRQDAYCLARLGRLAEAVERTEAGRTRALTEALARDRAVLERANPADRQEMEETRQRVQTLEAEARFLAQSLLDPDTAAAFAERSHALHAARQDLARIQGRIRHYEPGFMPVSLSLQQIAEVASPDCPLVYLLSTEQGSLALLVPGGGEQRTGMQAVWLDDFCDRELGAILYGEGDAHGFLFEATQGQRQGLMEILESMSGALGTKLMAPLAQRLSAQGYARCKLVPCGPLGLLPLHAALDTAGPPIDKALEMAYAPSAGVLRHLQAPTRPEDGSQLLAVADPPHVIPLTLDGLALSVPTPRLLHVRAEVQAIAALFPKNTAQILPERQATRQAVLESARQASYLHFSCHGEFDAQEPLRSGLFLAGEDRLTLADLLDQPQRLSARLAVLAACRTALIEVQRVPDETVGLPAGFLQAGVRGVIGTLWPVNDVSTGLLLTRFYQLHLQESLPPASALRQAQRWLRESTAGEMGLAEYYERAYRESEQREEHLLQRARYYQEHAGKKPFAHPYYWAAFTFTGVGE